MSSFPPPMRVVLLCGGVGGARFAQGLECLLPPGSLTIVVNTGDDFDHLGLPISPDLDTVMYTLSGLADAGRGWGVAGETFRALDAVRNYGGPSWFALGDRDLGTHLVRRHLLLEGRTLSQVTARLCDALGVRSRVLPMTDDPFATWIETVEDGGLPFQDWLVRHRAPPVRAVRFRHDGAEPAPGVLDAIEGAEVVLVAPSNPYVSIDPILALPRVRDVLATRPVVAVSPIVAGKAVKGPLAEMIPALSGVPPSAEAVARHYGSVLRAFLVHRGDRCDLSGLLVGDADIVMGGLDGRARVAKAALDLFRRLA